MPGFVFDQTNWTECPIQLENEVVIARYRRFGSGSERSDFICENWRQAYEDGYTMFSRLVDLPMEKEKIPGTNIEVLKSQGPPLSEVWCVETHDLSLLVGIADNLGFAAQIGDQSDLIRDLKDLLKLVSERGSIALTQVDTAMLLFERVVKSVGLMSAEIDQILKFNRRFFQLDFKSKHEEADGVRNWRSKGFFTVGCI